MRPVALGIDIGTTHVKGLICDAEGNRLGYTEEAYLTSYPKRGWAEQRAEDWWQALCRVTNRLSEEIRGQAVVRALGISSHAPSYVPVDRNGQALGPAMIWMDRRADAQANWLRDTIGEQRIMERSGNRIDSFYILPKMLWHQQQERALYESTYCVLQVNGYVNFRLTGVYSLDEAHASLSLGYDSSAHCWDTALFEQCGLDVDKLPQVFPCGNVIGEITPQAAKETGLPIHTPVIAGTVDGAAAAFEAGVIGAGDAAEMSGTSSVLIVCPEKPTPTSSCISMNHALAGKHLMLAAMSTTGASLKWFKDQVLLQPSVSYDEMNVLVDQSRPKNDLLFLPYLMGERSPLWDSNARGVWMGMSLDTERGDLMRAIMEGCAFALKQNVESMRREGVKIPSIRLVGGTSRSETWNQIKADILNIEVDVFEATGGAPLAVAVLAGAAVGLFPDQVNMMKHAVKKKASYMPNEEMSKFYQDKYLHFLSLYESLRPNFQKMTRLMAE